MLRRPLDLWSFDTWSKNPALAKSQAEGSTPWVMDCTRDDRAPGLEMVVNPDASLDLAPIGE